MTPGRQERAGSPPPDPPSAGQPPVASLPAADLAGAHLATAHLSDEQFSDLLAGELPGDDARTHLTQCAHCRGELEAVRSATGDFNAFSLAWAKAQAPRRVPTPSRWVLHLGVRPSWGLGLATALTACLLTVVVEHPWHTSAREIARAVASEPTTAELAEDNRLLLSIDQELRSDPEPAVAVSALLVADHPTAPPATTMVAN